MSCGLCLNICPTYSVSQIEAESPRGRLSIIQGLLAGKFQVDQASFKHIDSCLMCGACERLCPANVQYVAVVDQAKVWLKKKHYSSLYDRFFNWLVFKPWRINFFSRLISLYKLTGSQKLLPIAALESFQGTSGIRVWKEYYPASDDTKAKGEVYLFKGCVASLFDQDTIESSINMLNIAGFNVLFPQQQRCCGTLAKHSGDSGCFIQLQSVNKKVFIKDIPMIVTSTGCFDSVKNIGVNPHETYDILDFLNQNASNFRFKKDIKSDQKVAMHIPCSKQPRRLVNHNRSPILAKLKTLAEMDFSQGCCGSAGTYMYRNRALASTIAQTTVKQISDMHVSIILTQNIGCRMQLMKQTKKTNLEVMHPVTWLSKNIL